MTHRPPQPLSFALEEFNVRPKAMEGTNPDATLGEEPVDMARFRAVPIGEGYAYNGYRIYRALHASNEATQERMSQQHGKAFAIAQKQRVKDCPEMGQVEVTQTVGFVRRDLMWVHPNHRGNGLAPELCVEMLCMMGCEQWDKAQWMQWLHTPAFTPAGYSNRRKVFERLVARGVIMEVKA